MGGNKVQKLLNLKICQFQLLFSIILVWRYCYPGCVSDEITVCKWFHTASECPKEAFAHENIIKSKK